jgi:hypothetical protein
MARKIYVGIDTEFSEFKTNTVDISTEAQLATYFTVTHDDSYRFNMLEGVYTSANKGIHGTTARTTLTALQDVTLSCDYSVSSEDKYDEFKLKVGDSVIATISGTDSGSWSGSVPAGTKVIFEYYKDNSTNDGNDRAYVRNIKVTTFELVDTEVKPIAHKVRSAYLGISKPLPSGYTALDGLSTTEDYGNAYIDTGYIPNNNTSIVMDMKLNSQGTEETIFGSWGSAGKNSFYLQLTGDGYGRTYAFAFYGKSGYVDSESVQQTVNASDRLRIDINKDRTIIGDEVFDTSYADLTFTCNYSMALFGASYDGSFTRYGKMTLYSCQIYDNGTLVRDFVPCSNSIGTRGLYDVVNGKFYPPGSRTNAQFAPSSTLDSSNWKTGVARRIFKAYVGVGGVARPFWGGDKLSEYGAITGLYSGRYAMASTSVGNYALFAGGWSANYSDTNNVDTYDKSLTHSHRQIGRGRNRAAATTVGNHALIAGSDDHKVVDALDSSLTLSNPADLTYQRINLAATTVGNYAIFAGGCSYTDIEVYDSSLTKIAVNNTIVYRTMNLAATTVGNYAIFAGGSVYNAYDEFNSHTVAFDSSLTTNAAFSNLSSSRERLAAATVGNYAIFAGGYSTYTDEAYDEETDEYYEYTVEKYHTIGDVYDNSLTKLNYAVSLVGNGASDLAATTVGNNAIFYGGHHLEYEEIYDEEYDEYYTDSYYSESGDATIFTDTLTKRVLYPINTARTRLSAATVGNYAIFAGGQVVDPSGPESYSTDAYAFVAT